MTDRKSYSGEELVLLSIQGDVRAFGNLYELHKDKVFAFAYTLTKSKDVAEEVVQEVFTRLWEKRHQIAPGYSFPAYLRKITYHEVLAVFRKVKRSESLREQLYANMQAIRQTGADELIGKELARLYREAVERLPPQKKEIYLLSRDADMSYEEIAGKMGLSKNTVRNHMTEAIRQIRQYVASHGDLTCLVLAICLQ